MITTPEGARPLGRDPIEAQHGGAIIFGVAAVLEILGARIEGHELVEKPIVGRELDHGAAGRVPPDDVAGLEQMVQQDRAWAPVSIGRAVTGIG